MRKTSISKSFAFPTLFIICITSFFSSISFASEDSLCARVKMEIKQEATLERQAFDAHMRINNGAAYTALENISIDVSFTDEDGNPILASSDPDNTEAMFFFRIDTLENIDDIDGSGTVSGNTSADIHWLIIPAADASNGLESGTLYYVGAILVYTIGGEEYTTTVSPDYIFVKPLPELILDYFIPNDVYGDDPLTPEIEPTLPFSLGVRVLNTGAGTVRNLKIDSAQPKIVDNEQGLLIGFNIEGSEVNGNETTPSLLTEFGDIRPNEAGVARWTMTCSLYGKFVKFTADFSHSNELGGELTSLIEEVNTHLLVHDVLVDLPGRDGIRDFLSKKDAVYTVYESNSTDTQVTDLSSTSSLSIQGSSGTESYYTLNTPSSQGFIYVQMPDPFNGEKILKRVICSNGKLIKTENAWLSKTRDGSDPWQYFVNLFDVNSSGTYTLIFDDSAVLPQSPVLQFIPDRSREEGRRLSFIVEATDPNGTIPMLSATSLPAGADFTDQKDGTAEFDWTPTIGQAGVYRVKFTASDGALTDYQYATLTITVTSSQDGDGMDDEWELNYFGTTDRDGTGDFDEDGFTDQEEHDACSNPDNPDSYPKDTPIALNTGFNLIALPSDLDCSSAIMDLVPLFSDESGIEKILTFDNEENHYTTILPEDDFDPSFIHTGDGLIVYALQDQEITFMSVDCSGIDLRQGMNLVGFACPIANFSAYQLLGDLGNENIISIQRYNTEKGMFETAGFDNGQIIGVDFEILPGEGYFIFMKQEVDFNFK